jgi:hypothetical protein
MLYRKFPLYTKYKFLKSSGEAGDTYNFSSDLEKIGIENDVSIQNGTYVEPISDPVEIEKPQYGGIISVIKVKADVATDFHTIIKELWIPTIDLVKIK